MVEDLRGYVLLVRRERFNGIVEVIAHDLLGPSQVPKRRETQDRRPGRLLGLPDAFHDELKVWGFDTIAVRRLGDRPDACLRQLDPPGGNFVEDCFDELRLDADRAVGGQCVVALHGADDRLARRWPVEVLEPQEVPEEVRDTSLEPVELGNRVLS